MGIDFYYFVFVSGSLCYLSVIVSFDFVGIFVHAGFVVLSIELGFDDYFVVCVGCWCCVFDEFDAFGFSPSSQDDAKNQECDDEDDDAASTTCNGSNGK